MVTEIVLKSGGKISQLWRERGATTKGRWRSEKDKKSTRTWFIFAQPVFKKRDSVRIWYARMVKNLIPTWGRLARQQMKFELLS